MNYTLAQVALGGALGASGRYLTGILAVRIMGHGFPWGTLAVNVLGSFAMGVLVIVLAHFSATRWAPLLMTGVLGGFTTFSAFSLDTMALFERGQVWLAACYAGASVVLALGGHCGGHVCCKNGVCMSGVQSLTIGGDEAEQRLDRWFRRQFPHISQGRIEKMCRKGEIRVDGSRVKKRHAGGAGHGGGGCRRCQSRWMSRHSAKSRACLTRTRR